MPVSGAGFRPKMIPKNDAMAMGCESYTVDGRNSAPFVIYGSLSHFSHISTGAGFLPTVG